MFEIKISMEVHKYIELNYLEKLNSPIFSKDQNIFESHVIGILNTIKSIFEILKLNPFSYPKLENGIHFACHAYLPFILFYNITDKNVIIFDCKKREDLF